MVQKVSNENSLWIGEILTLVLGFGLCTLAVSARLYTKAIITKTLKEEDCE